MSVDLEQVIADSITDLELPADPLPEPEPEADVEAPIEAEAAPTDTTTEVDPTPQPASPTEPSKSPADDFDKKYGLSPAGSSGRENRIPYSRVRKIADNAAKDAVKVAKEGWTKELTTTHVPVAKYQELSKAVTEQYEPAIRTYKQWETMLESDPVTFVTRLAGLPMYAEILAPLFGRGVAQPEGGQPQAEVDDMPQPDRELSDGSRVYSMDGLKKLNEWNRGQARKDVMAEVDKRFGPMVKEHEVQEQIKRVLPGVQAQIAEARNWRLFNESEAEIVAVLQKNPRWGLERAYQEVVLPKLEAEAKSQLDAAKVDKDKVRADVIKELKQAPRSTSLSPSGVKVAPVTGGPVDMEDVIRQSIAHLKR